MDRVEALELKLAELSKKKSIAQKALHLEAAKPPLPPISKETEEKDPLDWTADEWKRKDQYQEHAKSTGYRNVGELAEATYKKEISKRQVDQDRYEKVMQLNSDASSFDVFLAAEDLEAIAQGLREASERRQKRRKVDDAGLYMNDRNRQFNLKLDREYGKGKD